MESSIKQNSEDSLTDRIDRYRKDGFSDVSATVFLCPKCGAEMIYLSSVPRKVRELKTWIAVHQIKCTACSCIRRVLPDFLEPYKQFSAVCIEAVVEEGEEVGAARVDTDVSSPTVYRWIAEYTLLMVEWQSKLIMILLRRTGKTVSVLEYVRGRMSARIRSLLMRSTPSYPYINILSGSRVLTAAHGP